MLGVALHVADLQITVSLNGGIEMDMFQASPVTVTCIMDGEKNIDRVVADEGIEFLSAGGFIGVDYKPCYDITHIASKREWRKMLSDQKEQQNG